MPELHRQREQIKDEMGLDELERMVVSGTEPDHEDVLEYRGARLFALLKDEKFAHYWLIIARSIGMVASEEAAKKLAAVAITASPTNSAAWKWHVKARAGAMWGLTPATRDQPRPWIREFLILHADADQWIKKSGEHEIDPTVAYDWR